MKRTIIYLTLILAVLTSCRETKNNPVKQFSKRIVITGKIVNSDPELRKIKFQVNRVGFSSTHLAAELDKGGKFSTSFESYIPTDVWFRYRTNFLVLTHPGDSIYVEFNGSLRGTDLFETIKFRGDAVLVNQEAAIFQKRFYSDNYNNQDRKKQALKDYPPDVFVSYVDSVKRKWKDLFNQFVTEANPDEETKIWASEFLYSNYVNRLSSYPELHSYYSNTKKEDLQLPDGFFNPILNRRPLDKSMLISGYAVSINLNNFHSAIYRAYNLNKRAKQLVATSNSSDKATKEILDSLEIYRLIEISPNDLYKQVMLTELFSKRMDLISNYEIFENHQKVAKQHIKEPFLWEPLYKQYCNKKKEMGSISSIYDTMVMRAKSSSAGMEFNNILNRNNGKVIYIDCWATWCGPCKDKMPQSNAFINEMRGKDVAFVFICMDSPRKNWESERKKLNIGGQHYLFSKQQSKDFRNAFKINGVPYYIVMDKNGKIVEKGVHLIPSKAKNRIVELLNE